MATHQSTIITKSDDYNDVTKIIIICDIKKEEVYLLRFFFVHAFQS